MLPPDFEGGLLTPALPMRPLRHGPVRPGDLAPSREMPRTSRGGPLLRAAFPWNARVPDAFPTKDRISQGAGR